MEWRLVAVGEWVKMALSVVVGEEYRMQWNALLLKGLVSVGISLRT